MSARGKQQRNRGRDRKPQSRRYHETDAELANRPNNLARKAFDLVRHIAA